MLIDSFFELIWNVNGDGYFSSIFLLSLFLLKLTQRDEHWWTLIDFEHSSLLFVENGSVWPLLSFNRSDFHNFINFQEPQIVSACLQFIKVKISAWILLDSLNQTVEVCWCILIFGVSDSRECQKLMDVLFGQIPIERQWNHNFIILMINQLLTTKTDFTYLIVELPCSCDCSSGCVNVGSKRFDIIEVA